MTTTLPDVYRQDLHRLFPLIAPEHHNELVRLAVQIGFARSNDHPAETIDALNERYASMRDLALHSGRSAAAQS